MLLKQQNRAELAEVLQRWHTRGADNNAYISKNSDGQTGYNRDQEMVDLYTLARIGAAMLSRQLALGDNCLEFAELRAANVERVAVFKNAHGEIAHPGGVKDWNPAKWVMATVGELGEAANEIKKVLRGDTTLEEARQRIAYELADTLTYLDLCAANLDIDLGQVTVEKFNIVSERIGSSIRL